MKIVDQLYGVITLPEWLNPVILSPEVQRLRDVRLINITSHSCPSLSDTRRYAHTIGVCMLASRLSSKIKQQWSSGEEQALLVAALVHDIATPAFGHLFEYLYKAKWGWDHEEIVERVIRGTYRTEKRYHQIYYKNTLRLHKILSELKIDIDLVIDLVRGKNLLGKILAGSVDLDNIENVYRMATLLGLECNVENALHLVDSMIPAKDGLIFGEAADSLITVWQNLRCKVYNFLTFDEVTLSGQAMLTDCLTLALQGEVLNQDHWFFTDEQLTQYLIEKKETKEIIKRFAIGDVYRPIFLGWYSCPKGEVDLREPRNRDKLKEDIKAQTGIPCSPYIFYDDGTFSKDISIDIETSGGKLERVVLSKKSQSTIVGVFTSSRLDKSAADKLRGPVKEVLRNYGYYDRLLKPIDDAYDFSNERKRLL
jgi:hypothetical protein